MRPTDLLEPIEPTGEDRELQRVRLNQETARIPWRDLQRFFAQGKVISIHRDLDLVETALSIARDETDSIAPEIASGRIAPVTDEAARRWLERDAHLWAVVVKPWILAQEDACESGSMPTPARG